MPAYDQENVARRLDEGYTNMCKLERETVRDCFDAMQARNVGRV